MPSTRPVEVVADGEGLPEPAGQAMPEVAPPDRGSHPAMGGPSRPRPRQDWRVLVAIFCLTSAIEGIGVSQIYAFVPSYLLAMGVPDADRFRFVGLFGSLIFVVGAPLVPLWGVWADKYSRKAVIVRSSVVMATVLVGIALSREPWQLAASMLLIGLQLGNTGVMLAEIRDVTPRPRLGRAIAVFGASSPVGFALGPAIGGVIVDGLHFGLPAVFAISAVLTLGIVLLVSLGSSEVRPEVVPKGSVLRLAFGAVRGVLADRAVLGIFAIFAITILATQMTRSYLPVLVESLVPGRTGLASAIALVTGVAALSGAVVSPVGGAIGDRIGFRPVLLGALVGAGCALFAMPIVGSVWLLALAALVLAAMYAAASAMVFGLLATEVAPERRSATLNLVYLPLYAAGTVGPLSGAVAVSAVGLPGPFLLGGTIFLAGAAAVGASLRRRGQLGRSRSAGPT